MIAQELEVSLHMAFLKPARLATNSLRWSICCLRCWTIRRPRKCYAHAPPTLKTFARI